MQENEQAPARDAAPALTGQQVIKVGTPTDLELAQSTTLATTPIATTSTAIVAQRDLDPAFAHCLRPGFTQRIHADLKPGAAINLVARPGQGAGRLLADLRQLGGERPRLLVNLNPTAGASPVWWLTSGIRPARLARHRPASAHSVPGWNKTPGCRAAASLRCPIR